MLNHFVIISFMVMNRPLFMRALDDSLFRAQSVRLCQISVNLLILNYQAMLKSNNIIGDSVSHFQIYLLR